MSTALSATYTPKVDSTKSVVSFVAANNLSIGFEHSSTFSKIFRTGTEADNLGSQISARSSVRCRTPTGPTWACRDSPIATAASGMRREPPGADPHARWCARGRGEPGPYPIYTSNDELTRSGRGLHRTPLAGEEQPPRRPSVLPRWTSGRLGLRRPDGRERRRAEPRAERAGSRLKGAVDSSGAVEATA
jgi:hypothetical protein